MVWYFKLGEEACNGFMGLVFKKKIRKRIALLLCLGLKTNIHTTSGSHSPTHPSNSWANLLYTALLALYTHCTSIM